MQSNLRQVLMPRMLGAGSLFLGCLVGCTLLKPTPPPATNAGAPVGAAPVAVQPSTPASPPDVRPSTEARGAAGSPPGAAPAASSANPPETKTAAAGAAKAKAPRANLPAKASPAEEHPAPTTKAAGTMIAQPPDKAPAAPALDLAGLEQRLRDTHAIGVFTKLSLKNQVDDLLAAFRAFHDGQPRPPLTELRQRYDLLLLKVLTLLQDGDPPLAAAISASREAIWGLLADRDKFQKIQMG